MKSLLILAFFSLHTLFLFFYQTYMALHSCLYLYLRTMAMLSEGIQALSCWGRHEPGPGGWTGESWGFNPQQMLRPKRRWGPLLCVWGGKAGMGHPGQCHCLQHQLIITITQGTFQTTPVSGLAPDLLSQNLGGERIWF